MTQYGIRLRWLAVASYEIQLGSKTIVTDPYISDCEATALDYTSVEHCDFITLSHAHWDHITDMPLLNEKFRPKFLAGEMTALHLARWMDLDFNKIYPMHPDLELDFGDFKVKALYGRHGSGNSYGVASYVRDRAAHLPCCEKDPHVLAMQEIGSFEYRNFLFTLPSGVKLLFCGGAYSPELCRLFIKEKPDIVILQRAKKSDAIQSRARFVKELGAKVVLPHHHDFPKKDDPSYMEAMKKAVEEATEDCHFILPRHGEWIDL